MTNQGNSFGNPPVPPFERDQEEADLTSDDKKHFEADIDAMNVILLGIPNDIYNYVDACKTAQAMWQRVKRLMQGTDLSKHKLNLRFLDEFDKFKGIPGESIESPSYYVTHPPSVNDFDGDNQSYEFQGDASNDDQTNNLTITVMLLAKAVVTFVLV
ncbi:hypothetical protein Tco_0468054 [Tanacetum coccineum]